MAKMTLTLADGQTWIYPALSYTGYDYVKKTKNHWYKGHSRLEYRGCRCHQGGTSKDDGKYNGNMFSILLFKDSSGRSLKNAIKAIGGSAKITNMTLNVYVRTGWGGYFTPRVCATPYWDTSGLTGKSSDSYDGLGFKHLFTTSGLATGKSHSINLTNYKHHFDTYESIAFYCPGAYNASNSSYGCIDAQGNPYPATLTIEYSTNTAPNTPSVSVHTTKDSHGYITPALDFSVNSGGDPDGNLHSSPYNYQLFNQSGSLIKEGSWSSSNRFSYNLESYRGQTVKIRGIVRDAVGLTAYKDTNVYINSRPYWNGLGANSVNVSFTSGVTSGVFKDNVTFSWPKASDAQSGHNSNLRYAIYAQKGTDKGPSGDTSSNCIAYNLTSTSYTVNAASMSQVSVSKGERVYFSVWASDGLEYSSYRLTSGWINREQPPSKPSNLSPYGGHYESSISISWEAAPPANGLTYYHYVQLVDENDNMIKSYDVTKSSFTCSDLYLISRGDNFRFKIWTIDELGNSSTTAAVSNWFRRNSAPSRPYTFKVNSDKLFFKNSIPLIWSASSDYDGDSIRYNVYYNVNNGSYRSLVSGTSSLTATHNISSFNAGDTFNYYVEAYDSFGVYSSARYIAAKPRKSIPPEAPALVLPYADRTLYTNVPRIEFKTNNAFNDEKLKMVITINGVTYDSVTNSTLFNKSLYDAYENGMFTVPTSAPLNYSKKNTIKMKVNDTLEDSTTKEYNFIVEYPLVNKIEKSEDRLIKIDEFNKVKEMIDANRFAYGLSKVSWYDNNSLAVGSKILKKYYEQAIDNSYNLVTTLNGKAKADNVKRTYTKDIVTAGGYITKNMFNNIINMIEKP